jgi:hypothetical protein
MAGIHTLNARGNVMLPVCGCGRSGRSWPGRIIRASPQRPLKIGKAVVLIGEAIPASHTYRLPSHGQPQIPDFRTSDGSANPSSTLQQR